MVTLPLGNDYINITPMDPGGMGWLYKAFRKGLQVDVVIKRVKAEYAGKVNQRAEADILKRLKHRYLPRIYDIIDGGDGYLYTVMDYIPGIDMQRYVQGHGPVGQKQAHKWACQLCEVVAYLHEQHPPILHCDIKPSNLMITPAGDICLIDFNTSLVSSGMVRAIGGTSGYAAPEQYLRFNRNLPSVPPDQPTELVPEDEPPRPYENAGVTFRTDVYGIGATLYFLVTGYVPEISLGPVTPVTAYSPKVSQVFCSIILRAMEQKPENRFPAADQMLKALQDVDRLDARYRRYRLVRWTSNLLLILVLLCSIALTFYGGTELRSERENAYLSLVTQGEALGKQGEAEAAEELLIRAIRSRPGRAEGYLALASQLYGSGRYSQSYKLIENGIASGGLSLDNLSQEQAGDLLYIQANCIYELGDYPAAEDLYRKALNYWTGNTAYYRGLALSQARSGNLEEAHRTLETLSERDAGSLDCVIIQAELDLVEGRYQSAFDRYQEATGRTDDVQILSRIYLSGAEALKQMGNLDGYIDWLTEGVGRLAENGMIQREMLAHAYTEKALADPGHSMEWYGQAEQYLQTVVDAGWGTILTRLNLAVVMENQGKYKEAEDCLLSAKQQDPADYRVYKRLAFLYADWQSRLPADQRDYTRTAKSYGLARQYYEQAVANGESDDEMLQLEALMEQLRISGWIE